MDSLEKLTEEQQESLQSFLAVTGQSDIDVAILALQHHEWQLEAAVQAQFGDTPRPARVRDDSLGGLGVDQFANNDEHLPPPPPLPPTPAPAPAAATRNQDQTRRAQGTNPIMARGLFAWLPWLQWPINTIWSLFAYFYTMFPHSFRQAITGQSARSGPSRPPQDGSTVAARFLREFEESYGTTHPNFYAGGYTAALNKAKNDLRFLMVYLHSEEHDATDGFCKDTLTDEQLLSYLRMNDIVVWGGNVKEAEGFQVATTLQAVRYPFIGLIALSQTSSGSSSKMALIDRIEGSTTAEQIVQRLTTQITRQSAALERLRSERRSRDIAREIRQQQDDAYEQSLRADREKARQQKAAREAAEKLRREEERKEAERVAELQKIASHRRYLNDHLPAEPPAGETGCARLSFKLWDGERVIRRFRGDEPVENVYVFIDGFELRNQDQEDEEEEKEAGKEYEGYIHNYDFVLISPFPRTKVTDRKSLIKDQPALWPSASLVVELVEPEEELQ